MVEWAAAAEVSKFLEISLSGAVNPTCACVDDRFQDVLSIRRASLCAFLFLGVFSRHSSFFNGYRF